MTKVEKEKRNNWKYKKSMSVTKQLSWEYLKENEYRSRAL